MVGANKLVALEEGLATGESKVSGLLAQSDNAAVIIRKYDRGPGVQCCLKYPLARNIELRRVHQHKDLLLHRTRCTQYVTTPQISSCWPSSIAGNSGGSECKNTFRCRTCTRLRSRCSLTRATTILLWAAVSARSTTTMSPALIQAPFIESPLTLMKYVELGCGTTRSCRLREGSA